MVTPWGQLPREMCHETPHSFRYEGIFPMVLNMGCTMEKRHTACPIRSTIRGIPLGTPWDILWRATLEAYEIHHGGICLVVHVQSAIGCPIFQYAMICVMKYTMMYAVGCNHGKKCSVGHATKYAKECTMRRSVGSRMGPSRP